MSRIFVPKCTVADGWLVAWQGFRTWFCLLDTCYSVVVFIVNPMGDIFCAPIYRLLLFWLVGFDLLAHFVHVDVFDGLD
jgi:hypothetical protein